MCGEVWYMVYVEVHACVKVCEGVCEGVCGGVCIWIRNMDTREGLMN